MTTPTKKPIKTVTDGFFALDETLKLDPKVDASARQIRTTVDEVLTDAGLCQVSLLQGSYGRKTMYPPLKDVDLVVVLPRAHEGLRTDPQGPATAMAAFKTALIESGELPGVRFDVDDAPAHALQLTLPGVSFTFDLVPAFETEDPDWLVIADREKHRWDKRSDVRALRDKVAARNQECQGRWVRQVRQAKHALRQDKPVKELVCGLVIESLAYDAVTSAVTPQEAAVSIFARGEDALTGRYGGLAQDDLTRKWSMLDRRQVVGFFARNHRLAVEAMVCEANRDHAAASTLWRQIFGDEFPQIVVPFRDRLPSLVRTGGGVTSSGYLTSSPAVVAATNPGRAWRSR